MLPWFVATILLKLKMVGSIRFGWHNSRKTLQIIFFVHLNLTHTLTRGGSTEVTTSWTASKSYGYGIKWCRTVQIRVYVIYCKKKKEKKFCVEIKPAHGKNNKTIRLFSMETVYLWYCGSYYRRIPNSCIFYNKNNFNRKEIQNVW